MLGRCADGAECRRAGGGRAVPESRSHQRGGQAAPERRAGRTRAEGRGVHERGMSSATAGGAGFGRRRVDGEAPVSGAEHRGGVRRRGSSREEELGDVRGTLGGSGGAMAYQR